MTQEALNQMTQEQAVKDLVTPNGKKIGIYHVKNSSLYKAAFESGGELPPELNQMFTDTERAYKKAQSYVERRWKEAGQKEERDAYYEENPEKKRPGRPKKTEA